MNTKENGIFCYGGPTTDGGKFCFFNIVKNGLNYTAIWLTEPGGSSHFDLYKPIAAAAFWDLAKSLQTVGKPIMRGMNHG